MLRLYDYIIYYVNTFNEYYVYVMYQGKAYLDRINLSDLQNENT